MAVKSVMDEAASILAHDPTLPTQVVILEAGCGSTSDLELPFEKKIVGIDIDAEQLSHNEILDAKIQGDLQTYELPQNEFDIVACIDVLEHLPFPEKAIENMSRSVKPGGYLLLAGPEPYSYKGLVAKYTPHSMRFLIFKLLTGRSAREVRRIHGNGQIFIPTYLKPVCSRRNLAAAAKEHGFDVVFEKAVDGNSNQLRPIYKPLVALVGSFARFMESLTAGRVNLLLADFVLLLKKSDRPSKQQVTTRATEESLSPSGVALRDHEQQPTGQ